MSLVSILTSSQSLQNTETQIGVVSKNVSNSQNANYVARQSSIVQNGSGIGVVDVTRQVDSSLQQALLSQSAMTSGSSTVSSLYTQLEQLTGSATGTPVLSSATSALVTAFQNFATTPESTSTQSAVVQAATNLVNTVSTISAGVETIASQVQQQTETDVKTLNADLTKIAQLNASIQSTKSVGQSSADLEDQRDSILTEVAGLVPVKTVTTDDGTLNVSTPDGVSLVSGAAATQFTYTGYTLGAGGVQGTNPTITITGAAGNLSQSFSTGKIGAELSFLAVDDTSANSLAAGSAPLEKIRRQLDSFVDQFYSTSPATPTTLQAAYDNATTNTGELASSLFVVNSQGAGGSPQPAGDDRNNFQVNSALTAGTSTLKIAAANPVLQALTGSNTVSAVTAGDVSGFTGSISGFANSIVNAQTQRASTAKAQSDQNSTTLSSVQSSYASNTGVSVDTELSQLIVLQNSYNATAKVISVSNTMFQALVSAVS